MSPQGILEPGGYRIECVTLRLKEPLEKEDAMELVEKYCRQAPLRGARILLGEAPFWATIKLGGVRSPQQLRGGGAAPLGAVGVW